MITCSLMYENKLMTLTITDGFLNSVLRKHHTGLQIAEKGLNLVELVSSSIISLSITILENLR